MIQKLRWKFVLINMLIVSAILLSLSVVMVAATRDDLQQDSLSLLYEAATDDFSIQWPSYRQTQDRVNIPYFTVAVRLNGTPVLLENQYGAIENREQLVEIVRACMSQEAEVGVLPDYRLRYLRLAGFTGWRITFADISQEQRTIRALIVNLAFICLATLVVFFFISMGLARWATRPVEKSWQQQRQFVSDASHELKTPLTVILSNVDMLQNTDEPLSDRNLRRLDNIRASSGQMSQLVEELLTLARSDNLSPKNRIRETVSLSDLVTDQALLFEPVLFEAGKLLEEDIADGLLVTGDPSKLRQLVEILLDNARKYAAAPSTVTLTLHPEGNRRIRLSVNTKGEPIPKAQLERIFERFYRADEARTSEGFGLGLSIAAQIAREHDGKLWAESDPTAGNTFYFSLPCKK